MAAESSTRPQPARIRNTFDPEVPPGSCSHHFVPEGGVERCMLCSASRIRLGEEVWYRGDLYRVHGYDGDKIVARRAWPLDGPVRLDPAHVQLDRIAPPRAVLVVLAVLVFAVASWLLRGSL